MRALTRIYRTEQYFILAYCTMCSFPFITGFARCTRPRRTRTSGQPFATIARRCATSSKHSRVGGRAACTPRRTPLLEREAVVAVVIRVRARVHGTPPAEARSSPDAALTARAPTRTLAQRTVQYVLVQYSTYSTVYSLHIAGPYTVQFLCVYFDSSALYVLKCV